MEKQEEYYRPKFPALSLCVIIDARHSSRKDIVRDVKASALFENIFEAKSISDGVNLISDEHSALVAKQEIDACILGPSVSPEIAKGFIASSAAASSSKDCAFIAVIAAGSSNKEELLAAGAHRVIEIPTSKKHFYEGIVRGVIAANKNSPWVSIVLNADEQNISLFHDEPDSAVAAPPPKTGPDTLSDILRKSAPEMKKIAIRVEEGDLAPEHNGKPSREARAVVARLLIKILGDDEQDAETDGFREFLEEALLSWLLDLRSFSAREASNILHRRLLRWRKK